MLNLADALLVCQDKETIAALQRQFLEAPDASDTSSSFIWLGLSSSSVLSVSSLNRPRNRVVLARLFMVKNRTVYRDVKVIFANVHVGY